MDLPKLLAMIAFVDCSQTGTELCAGKPFMSDPAKSLREMESRVADRPSDTGTGMKLQDRRIALRQELDVELTVYGRSAYGAPFYDRAKAAYAIVATGELRLYGNLILKKGVIRP